MWRIGALVLAMSIGGQEPTTSSEAARIEWFGSYAPAKQVYLLLRIPEIAETCRVSAEQSDQIMSLERRIGQQMADVLQTSRKKLSDEARREQMAAMGAIENEFRDSLWDILDTEQRSRIHGILLQLNVATALLQDDEAKEKLQLSDSQRQAIQGAIDEAGRKAKEVRKMQLDRDTAFARDDAITASRDEKAIGILNAEQRKVWAKLTGGNVDVVALRPRVDLRRARN